MNDVNRAVDRRFDRAIERSRLLERLRTQSQGVARNHSQNPNFLSRLNASLGRYAYVWQAFLGAGGLIVGILGLREHQAGQERQNNLIERNNQLLEENIRTNEELLEAKRRTVWDVLRGVGRGLVEGVNFARNILDVWRGFFRRNQSNPNEKNPDGKDSE